MVSFWLVIIEIADEIIDRITREECFKLRVKVRRPMFYVRNDQRRYPAFDNIATVNVLPDRSHRAVFDVGLLLDRLQQFGIACPGRRGV